MKSFIITLAVVLASQAYAGPKTAMRPAATASKVDVVEFLKKTKESAKSGKLSESSKKETIKYIVQITESVAGLNSTSLEVLITARPESLSKIIDLASIVVNGKADEKAKAEQDLQLLSLAGKYTAISKLEAETIEKVTEMADYNQAAKDFKAELIKTLDLNIARNITEAISTASKGKITLDQIKSCMI